MRICCIFNSAPHYREAIYRRMDRELPCDFYFGDFLSDSIRQISVAEFRGFKKILPIKPVPRTGFEWQKGVWKLAFGPYSHFIITGTPGSLSNWMLLLLARILGKHVFAWTHGMKGENTRFGTFVERNFYRLCHKILLYGEFSRSVMLEEGFLGEKLVPIYNSLNYEAQRAILETLSPTGIYENHFGNTHPVLIYIGRIQRSKRLDLLVEALRKLKDDGHSYNLVIVGAAADTGDIPELVSEHQLEPYVWFYGPCYEEETIGELLYNADLLVSPGPIGLTALHAATYGLPILTNDNFGRQMPEFEVVREGQTGDFFRENNLEDLCDKIREWTNLDNSKRNRIRESSLRVIEEKYNPERQIKTLRELINQTK